MAAMTHAKRLKLLFRADNALAAHAMARRWVDDEPNLELVRYLNTTMHYPDGPTWTGMWICTLDVKDTAQEELGL
jgi:hypothetical protein